MNQQDRWKEIQNSENSNEKFKTLMETYNHLNEEHQLGLRQKNELTEQLNRLKDEYQVREKLLQAFLGSSCCLEKIQRTDRTASNQ